MAKKGIDISRYQGKPDFAKLKNEVDFVILQAGYGRYAGQKDSEFERSYSECKKYGIPVGVYWFSYAASPQDAIYEATACMEVIKGKKFEYPIYFDIEGAACSGDVSGKCVNFCNELEKKGYFAGIYISRSPAQSFLSKEVCANYALWLAEYGGVLNWGGSVGMWQNSDCGRFSGISGNVDTDICYIDYPKLIKSAGLNGYDPEPKGKLDTVAWYKKGDKDKPGEHGIFCMKQRLKALGYTSLDDTGGFGGGTEKAVKDVQRLARYDETGEVGENFIKLIMK